MHAINVMLTEGRGSLVILRQFIKVLILVSKPDVKVLVLVSTCLVRSCSCLIWLSYRGIAFSVFTLLIWWQKGHLACKNWVVRYWRGYLFGAWCKWFAYSPADATASRLSLWSWLTQVVPETHTHTQHTTVLRLCGICPGQPEWAGTGRNIHPLRLMVVINHPYLLSPSTTIHGILCIQSTCSTVFFHSTISLFGLPLGLVPSTSYSIHFFTQSLSSEKGC